LKILSKLVVKKNSDIPTFFSTTTALDKSEIFNVQITSPDVFPPDSLDFVQRTELEGLYDFFADSNIRFELRSQFPEKGEVVTP